MTAAPILMTIVCGRMDTQQISDLFMIFNVSGDGSMSKQEFVYCWNGWIKKVFSSHCKMCLGSCFWSVDHILVIAGCWWVSLCHVAQVCQFLSRPWHHLLPFQCKGMPVHRQSDVHCDNKSFCKRHNLSTRQSFSVLSDWKLRRKKCEKLVQVDPLQDSEAQSFTQQKAKKNHISKVVSQHIINSSPNDKTCFWQKLCYCEGRSQFIN